MRMRVYERPCEGLSFHCCLSPACRATCMLRLACCVVMLLAEGSCVDNCMLWSALFLLFFLFFPPRGDDSVKFSRQTAQLHFTTQGVLLFLLRFEVYPHCAQRKGRRLCSACILCKVIMMGFIFLPPGLLRASGLFTCEFLLQPCSFAQSSKRGHLQGEKGEEEGGRRCLRSLRSALLFFFGAEKRSWFLHSEAPQRPYFNHPSIFMTHAQLIFCLLFSHVLMLLNKFLQKTFLLGL